MNIPSVVDLINKTEHSKQQEVASSNAKRQELMERAGELLEVTLVGPNNTRIPSYFCAKEMAFYPVFDN